MPFKVGDLVQRASEEETLLGPATILCLHRDAAWIVYSPRERGSEHWRYRSVDLADLEDYAPHFYSGHESLTELPNLSWSRSNRS